MRRLILPLLLLATFSGVGGRAPAAGYVGYLGCSQTMNAVQGYHTIGGKRFWPFTNAYSSGTVAVWASQIGGGEKWTAFKNFVAAYPPSQIWVQWCSWIEEPESPYLEQSRAVLAEVRKIAPGVPIYVSAQNGYHLPHACSISGIDGPARMEWLALQNVVTSGANRGPHVGELRSRYQTPSALPGDETVPDGCHANAAGKTNVLGPALLQFFG